MNNIINPILLASTICLILSSFYAQSNDETPNVNSATPAHPPMMEVISRGEYAGAKACGACHQQKYNDWAGSRHGSMLRKLYTDGNTITAPWGTAETPLTFKDSGNHQYTSYMKGDKYWVTLHDAVNSKNDLDFQIDVVGYKTTQMFLSWDEANQNYITMPFIYWDWQDSNPKQPSPDNQWTPLTSGIFFYNADGSLFTGDKLELSKRAFGFTNFCMECHSTGFEVSSWEVQDTALGNRVITVDNTSKTVELGIACEKCHGPGAKHVRTQDADDIIQPINELTGEKAGDQCNVCHIAPISLNSPAANQTGYGYKFNHNDPLGHGMFPNVGDDLKAFQGSAPYNVSYWPGTKIRRQIRTHALELAESKHGEAGFTCVTCHDPHSQKLKFNGEQDSDKLCSSCHAEKDSDAHKLNAHNAVDIKCTDCHMPWMKHAGGRGHRYDGRSHSWDLLTPTDSLKGFDLLRPYTEKGADPDAQLTKDWQSIQAIKNLCYDNFNYPINVVGCVKFDILPNACSSCHTDEFPTPGVFTDAERAKLVEGEKRLKAFKKLTQQD
ncbi:cytochrome c3 family protein [Shewanella metallivivens]|uniref:Cytochrome c3 family protein n=1 Tax=Shewanella metallivivens TaxID=2872342 RepID=A0ABT5TIJ0_9GAMM|nr:cytochrome c3 family protein [Shewanella metallivivens]MDD8058419.1 cytochrome c3 family protein [Shewanella metallivivens]